MPKKKPYVPKIRGCYECSQRRIHCDRTEPQCVKCNIKGLKCSGMAVRYRFSHGISSRGKWTGKGVEEAFAPKQGGSEGNSHGQIPASGSADYAQESSRSIRWRPCKGLEHCPSKKSPYNATANKPKTNTKRQVARHVAHTPRSPDDPGAALEEPQQDPLFLESFSQSVSSWKRFLLLRFSSQIAPEMVVVDGPHNGWRHFVLPMALADETLMDAVLAASTFHHSITVAGQTNDIQTAGLCTLQPPQHQNARQLYVRAINGLSAKDLDCSDKQSQHIILLTLLVLLTSTMVTADSDFVILCRLLQSAVDVIGGEEQLRGGDLADFINRQVHKLLSYAASFLSEANGVATISSPERRLGTLDCLNHCVVQHPEHQAAVSLVADLITQAQEMYLNQFDTEAQPLAASQPTASVFRVQKFIDTLHVFPYDSPGEQVLVWASFIAASACTLDEHKAFFEAYLLQHYLRSGFLNLVKGLEHLRYIWAREPGERWTVLLPRAGILVM